jgi:serine/threonine protein kinase
LKDWENVLNYLFYLYNFIYLILIVKTTKLLGTGGQGNVYSVIDPDTKEKYAIKRISTKEGGKNLVGEIEIILNKNLQHINLVRYFTFFPEGEFINIIMEFCSEGNLDEYLKKFTNGEISEEVFIF